MKRRVFVQCTLAALVTACQAAPVPSPAPTRLPPTAGEPAPAPEPAATPTIPSAASPAVSPSTSSVHDILFVRDDYGVRTLGQIAVVDATTGRQLRQLPLGTPTSDWSTIYSTTWNDGRTTLQATNPTTGRPVRQMTIEGTYDLAGLTPSGSQLVLQYVPSRAEVETYTKDERWKSRFLVLDGSLSESPFSVALDGGLSFDAISPDGTALYLVEDLPALQPTEYRVRWYDIHRGALQPGAIADKSGSETISALRLSAVPSRNGTWLYSLYLDETKGPFVHALNLEQRVAVRVDLPAIDVADYEKQLLWALAMASDGTSLYAANGALGCVGAIDLAQLRVVRSADLPVASAPATGLLARLMAEVFPTAEAKRLLQGGAALSPDGRRLFVVAEKGLLAIETADLTPRWHSLPDRHTRQRRSQPEWRSPLRRRRGVWAHSRPGPGHRRGARHGSGRRPPLGILRVAG